MAVFILEPEQRTSGCSGELHTGLFKLSAPGYRSDERGPENQKGPLQLQKLDQSLAGDVVFAAEAYTEGLLPERIMEGG